MTENQIKEAISKEVVRLLAFSRGFKVVEPPQDHGVDLIITPVTKRIEPSGANRYLDSPHKLDLQLKTTTTSGVVDEVDFIKYDLEVKTFNDLVQRKDDYLPLHLILIILTENPPNCVNISEDNLSIMNRAYWYLPPENEVASNNDQRKRIEIPKGNLITNSFIRDRYVDLGVQV